MNNRLIFAGIPFIYSGHLWLLKLAVEVPGSLGTFAPEDGAGEPVFKISAAQQSCI